MNTVWLPVVDRDHMKDNAFDDGARAYCQAERVDDDYFRFCVRQGKRKAGMEDGELSNSNHESNVLRRRGILAHRFKIPLLVLASVLLDIHTPKGENYHSVNMRGRIGISTRKTKSVESGIDIEIIK